MKIGTHNGIFHADDVLACAILKVLHPNAAIIRTRDAGKLAECDILVDVGHVYDPSTRRFDHHQDDAPVPRPNGVKYSSAGLVWKHYGQRCLTLFEADWGLEMPGATLDEVDLHFIQPVCAHDNGQALYAPSAQKFSGVRPLTFSVLLAQQNPVHEERPNAFMRFNRFTMAVEMAREFLYAAVLNELSALNVEPMVAKAIAEQQHEEIIVFPRYPGVRWRDAVLDSAPRAVYVMFPNLEGYWQVIGVPVEQGSYTLVKPLPATWGGLKDTQLQEVTGVSDAMFAHRNAFLAIARGYDGARQLAEIALKA